MICGSPNARRETRNVPELLSSRTIRPEVGSFDTVALEGIDMAVISQNLEEPTLDVKKVSFAVSYLTLFLDERQGF